MMTAEQYIESIRALGKRNVYVMGEKVDNIVDHPLIRPSINCCAMTYKLAEEGQPHRGLMVVDSHLSGKPINRFTNIHQSTDQLVSRIAAQRLCGAMTGSCYQRCAGLDALNATWSVTYDTDQKHGTEYHKRFRKFLEEVQEKDLVVAAAMTDPKGNRSLPPSKQADPDLFLHISKRDEKGVYVRGSKLHLTGGLNSHYILVFPTQNMSAESEKDYVISGAVPANDPTITFIYGRQSCDLRKLEPGDKIDVGNCNYGGQEVVTVFNDTFIPWEMVFMCGETDMIGALVERFAGYHRQSYAGCKSGNGDVLIGAAAAIAEYNGVPAASHIKDKLVEMIQLNETLYSCGLGAGAAGRKLDAGCYMIDVLLANVCKQNVTRFPYEIARLAQDLAGGIMVTMPSEADFRHPEVGALCRQILAGDAKFTPEERQRMLRLIEAMTLGSIAVGYLTESMHGAGSPQAQRIMIQRGANLERKKKMARRLCGIDPDGLF
ncbi:4-hydroxybutyryl-CoA dehydratase [Desulfovibrio sp. OttesenSCG-928-C14]|nr:4-hydroxybutyryl-CoA dehydratase [Desulfovibrio sp. OttesenSCG-928-C14]